MGFFDKIFSKKETNEPTQDISAFIKYDVKDGCAVIWKVDCKDIKAKNVEIPAKLGGYPVIKLEAPGEEGVFRDCNLKTIALPNSITEIGKYAFAKCANLTSIIIPDSVTTLGVSAFAECASLISISLPPSITNIAVNAFTYCEKLISISIPDTVTEIGAFAFKSCGLKSIVIPNSVQQIDDCAFYHNKDLLSIVLPKSVKSMGKEVFGLMCSRTAGVKANLFYAGSTAEELRAIQIPPDVRLLYAELLKTCDVRFYSESEPRTKASDYWHYVNDKPTAW